MNVSYGQVASGDSLDLVGILNTNCVNCPLLNDWVPTSPVSSWSGISVDNGRVVEIDVSNRGLSGALAPLDNCTELYKLICDNNQLTNLGSLSSCTKLGYLWCANNDLLSLPDPLVGNSLISLICNGNQLTTIPDVSNHDELHFLYCHSNHLRDLPSLVSNTKLKYLSCYDNQLTHLPILAQGSNLEQLYCNDNLLREISTLESCANLTHLHCSNNYLKSLPDLAQFSNLQELWFVNNRFTFKELESILPYLPQNFKYAPQRAVTLTEPLPVFPWATPDIAYYIGGCESNVYNWDSNPSSQSSIYSGSVTNPNVPGLSLVINPFQAIVVTDSIRCGDTNQDGKRDMMDLASLGHFYGTRGYARPFCSFDANIYYPSLDWVDDNGNSLSMSFGDEKVNVKHADCNGDGIIDGLDMDCIKQFYEPLSMPSFLTDQLTGNIELRAEAQEGLIRRVGNTTKVEVPYRILVKDLPSTGLDVRGVVFTRPVSKNRTYYDVDTIFASFAHSDLITDSSEALWLQVFHRDMEIQLANAQPDYPCLDASDNPLDVGVFNNNRAISLGKGSCALDCIVTIDITFRQGAPTPPMIPLTLHTYNVALFVEGSNQNREIIATHCTSDTTWLDPSYLFFNPLPIELLSFDANPIGNDVKVAWTTSAESSFDYLVLERSWDGSDWEEVVKVNDQGDGIHPTHFEHIDQDILPSPHTSAVYRLKEVDIDGNVSWSPAIEVDLTLGDNYLNVAFFPSLLQAGGLLYVQTELSEEQTSLFEIVSVDGRVLYEQLLVLPAGVHETPISISLSEGIYFVRMRGDIHLKPHKIVVN